MAKPIPIPTTKKFRKKSAVISRRRNNNKIVVSHQMYCSRLCHPAASRFFNQHSELFSLQNITPELFIAFLITAILVMFVLFSEATAFPELRPVAPSDINNHLDRFIDFHEKLTLAQADFTWIFTKYL